MELRKQPGRKAKTKWGVVQDDLVQYRKGASFTPRPYLKMEQIMVAPPPPQIKPEPGDVFPVVGTRPAGCIKCKEEEGDCKKEPGQVKMEPVSPVPDNSNSSTSLLSTLSVEGELFS